MPFRAIVELLYSFPSSSRRDARWRALTPPAGAPQRQQEDYWGEGQMAEYHRFVKDCANGRMPSEIFLNRSPEHAAIVFDAIFRKAQTGVHIVTNGLSIDVYGEPHVIIAATHFMHTHHNARIEILAERPVDRLTHPLLQALDIQQWVSSRVSLRYIPFALQKTYKFNFAVADALHYRFETARTRRQAMVQFGEPLMGGKLEKMFSDLSNAAVNHLEVPES